MPRIITILTLTLLLSSFVSIPVSGDEGKKIAVSGSITLQPSTYAYYIVCPIGVRVESPDIPLDGYTSGDLRIYPIGVIDKSVNVVVEGKCTLYKLHPAVIFEPPLEPHVIGVVYVLPPKIDVSETADIIVRLSNIGEEACESWNISFDGKVIGEFGSIEPGKYDTEIVSVRGEEGEHSIEVVACDFQNTTKLVVEKMYQLSEEEIYFTVLNEWFSGQRSFAETVFSMHKSDLRMTNKERLEKLLSTPSPNVIQAHIAWSWTGEKYNLVLDIFNLGNSQSKVKVSVHSVNGAKPPNEITLDISPKAYSTAILSFEVNAPTIDLGILKLESDKETVEVHLPVINRPSSSPMHIFIPFIIATSSLVVAMIAAGYGLLKRRRAAEELREKLGEAGDLLGKGRYKEAVETIAPMFVRKVRELLSEKPSTPISELAKKCMNIDPNLAWALNYINDVIYGRRRARFGETQRLLEYVAKFVEVKEVEI